MSFCCSHLLLLLPLVVASEASARSVALLTYQVASQQEETSLQGNLRKIDRLLELLHQHNRDEQLEGAQKAAQQRLELAQQLRTQLPEQRSTLISSCYTVLGELQTNRGNFSDALASHRAALVELKAVQGAKPYVVSDAQRAVERAERAVEFTAQHKQLYVESLKRTRDAQRMPPQQALQAFTALSSVMQELFGDKSLDYASILIEQARRAEQASAYADADLAYCKAIPLMLQHLGADHPDTANTFEAQGSLYLNMTRYPEAEAALESAVEGFTRTLGETHPYSIATMANLAKSLAYQGLWDRALQLQRKVVDLWQQLPETTEHQRSQHGTALNNLAMWLREVGDHASALRFVQEALKIHRSLFEESQELRVRIEYPRTLNNVAGMYLVGNAAELAVDYFHKALRAYEELSSAGDPRIPSQIALTWGNLGYAHWTRWDHAEALRCYTKALAMYDDLIPPGSTKSDYMGPILNVHIDRAKAVNNLGLLFESTGELMRALPLYQESLHWRERVFDKIKFPNGHRELAIGLLNLGTLCSRISMLEEARKYLDRCIAMTEKLSPRGDIVGGQAGLALSGVLERSGADQEEVLKPLKRGADEVEAWSSPISTERLRALTARGRLHYELGEYSTAETVARQALALSRQIYGDTTGATGHPEVARAMHGLAVILASHENLETALVTAKRLEAFGLLEEAAGIEQARADQFASCSSEAETLNYSLQRLDHASLYLTLVRSLREAQQLPQQMTADRIYAFVWQQKAATMRVLSARHQEARTKQDEKLKALLDVRRDLERLQLAPANMRSPERMHQLSRRKEDLERGLGRDNAGASGPRSVLSTPHTALIAKLPTGVVFVDLFLYLDQKQKLGFHGKARVDLTPRYSAFILRRQCATVLEDLGPAIQIDEAVATWRKEIVRGEAASDKAATLRRMVWDKLERNFGKAGVSEPGKQHHLVMISGDGSFHALPWCALPGGKPDTALVDDYAISGIPSGPYLLERLTHRSPPGRKPAPILLVDEVDYDARFKDDSSNEVAAVTRGGKEQGEPWAPLKRHHDMFARFTAKSAAREVVTLSKAEATADRIAEELSRVDVAFIETHGLYRQLGASERILHGERVTPAQRHPLGRCALVCAGGNLASREDESARCLTGERIGALSLQRLRLVVLGACVTSQGDLAINEGVLGLPRAFHYAGAQCVVASLWDVPHTQSGELMARLFANLWDHNFPMHEALRQAQSFMRSNGRGVGSNPYYWAAWTMSGVTGDL